MPDLMHDRVVAAIGDLYDVEAELGRGGMSVVFRARDVRLRRPVALKALPPELAYREDVRTRFLREAQMAARLTHPNIVPIYAVDERDGLVYYAMALVEGRSLKEHLAREPRPPLAFVLRLLREVADALAYAHAHGVVHRDIKPDNVMIDAESGRAVVTDFGIARAAEGDSRLTVTGIAIGTPAYMSPEQALGEVEVDGRSDVYSLGIVAYEMLAGAPPFRASNTPAMLMKHVGETPRPLAELRPDLPGALVGAIERALAKRRDDRWPTAGAFRDALEGIPTRERPSHGPAAHGDHRAAREPAPYVPAPQSPPAPSRPAWPPPAGEKPRLPAWYPGANGRNANHDPSARRGLPVPGEREEFRDHRRSAGRRERHDSLESFRQLELGHQIERFRRQAVWNVAISIFLIFLNAATAGFPWAIFPVLGMMGGVLRRWRILRRQGVGIGDVIAGEVPEPSPAEALPGGVERLTRLVNGFSWRAKGAAISAAVAVPSLMIGGPAGLDFLIPPFVLGSAGMVVFGGGALRRALKLRRLGMPWREALRADWRERLPVAAPELAQRIHAEEMKRLAPSDVLAGPYGDVIRGAAADRDAIVTILSRLGATDRSLLPDVMPTVRGLEERILSLAQTLHRLDADVRPDALDDLDRRLAAARAEVAAGSTTRHRTVELLERQRATLQDLLHRRESLDGQLRSATLLLQTIKLDLVKLRSAGVDAALHDVTSATQQARALSGDIGRALEVADEVRRL